jgi:integrase
MASIREKRESPFYYVCLTLPEGRRQFSTKIRATSRVADRRKAERLADILERDVLKAANESEAVALVADLFDRSEWRARDAAAALARSILKSAHGELRSLSLGDYAEHWLKQKAGEVSESSLRAYRSRLGRIVDQLGERTPLAEITRKAVLEWRAAMVESVGPNTVNGYVALLSAVFVDAIRDEAVSSNPCAHIKALKASGSKRRPFTLDELKRLLDHSSAEWRSIVLVAFYTGQRLGDVARLTWQAVDLPAGEIRFLSAKTGRAMIIPIHPALSDHLETMPSADRPDEPLHPHAAATVARLGNSAVLSGEFRELLRLAGLDEPTDRRGSGRTRRALTFHSLRHTATSLLKNAGVSAPVVQELIGHNSEAVNRLYTHIDGQALREATERLPRL